MCEGDVVQQVARGSEHKHSEKLHPTLSISDMLHART